MCTSNLSSKYHPQFFYCFWIRFLQYFENHRKKLHSIELITVESSNDFQPLQNIKLLGIIQKKNFNMIKVLRLSGFAYG